MHEHSLLWANLRLKKGILKKRVFGKPNNSFQPTNIKPVHLAGMQSMYIDLISRFSWTTRVA